MKVETAAIARRMIFPERVFAISLTIHTFFGLAFAPILVTIVSGTFIDAPRRRRAPRPPGWEAALDAHPLAPPDAGFPARLRALSNAAADPAAAFELGADGGRG